MADEVVSNAGPLIALAKLNLLHLLQELYGRVHFAQTVYDEAVIEGLRQGYSDAQTLRSFLAQQGWAPVTIMEMTEEVAAAPLDEGERESIALALAYQATLLIDEERGRAVARQQGVTVRGTLGILVQAYRAEHISADQLQLYFQQIVDRTDIWISPTLCDRVLREVLG